MLLYVPQRAHQSIQPGLRMEAPHWPPLPIITPVGDLKCDLRIVPLSSISLVTNFTQKVRFESYGISALTKEYPT